jgi:deazaflavin-dependent oxidoreductase (nitroreductase family)
MRSADDGRRLSSLMEPGYRFLVPRGHAVLTTTGRRSGQPRKKVIRAVRSGSTVFAVMLRPPAVALERPDTVSAWVWNVRADPRVTVKLGRRTYAGRAREIDDEAELAAARRKLCEGVYLVDYGEAAVHLRGLPTPARIRDLHGYWFDTGIPVAIDLESPKPPP